MKKELASHAAVQTQIVKDEKLKIATQLKVEKDEVAKLKKENDDRNKADQKAKLEE